MKMDKIGPNFFLVGVVKGGTTSLHRYLDQHPEVYMSPVKETNFFARNQIDTSKFAKDYAHDVDVDLSSYLKSDMSRTIHIAHLENWEDYFTLFKNVTAEKAIGDASNSYLLYPGVAEEIYEYNPNARIIMMLRNPAERAFSQYLMNLKQGKILSENFIEEIERDDRVANKGWGANHQYLFIGKYYEQLRRYYDVFPAEQIKVCLYDDYKVDPQAVMTDIFQFLKIDDSIEIDTSQKFNEAGVPKFKKLNYFINQSGVISWAKRSLPQSWRGPFKRFMYSGKEIPTLQNAERAYLIDYYKNDIVNLQRLIGKDLGNWLK